MISRKDFLKGALLGVGATVAAAGAIKAASGDLSYLTEPLDGNPNVYPKFNEEIKVMLLGTGSPTSGIKRSKPANAIMAADRFFIVDCGAGIVERLFMAGIPPSRITDLFITHHHSDHTSGFTDLFLSGWLGGQEPGRVSPLRVYGPTNTRLIIEKFMDAMKWDIDIRAEHTGTSAGGAMVEIHERNDGIVYDDAGIRVTAFTVDHGIVKPAIGYRFEYRGKVIVISGDTLPVESMIRHSERADVLIHEAYSREWMDRGLKRFPHMRRTIESVMNYHSSTLEAAEIARKAKVKHLVFTHLMPSPSPLWIFERNWAKGVSDIYNGKITVGRDLMVL